jgi:hypothetical protein
MFAMLPAMFESSLVTNDLYFSSVDFLLIADTELNSYKDWSSNNRTVEKQGSVSISSLTSKPCFLFAGDSDSTGNTTNGRINTSILAFGTDDYTLEFWGAQTSNSAGGSRFFELGSADANRSTLLLKYTSYDGVVLINNTDIGTVTLDPRDSILRHYCIMRKIGTTYFYINGILIFTSSTTFTMAQTALYLGTALDSRGALRGYIQQFRITKLARYTESGFTPDSVFYKS